MSDTRHDEPIRVLHVLHVLNRGGAETMVMNLYRRVDRSRLQFDFLVHTSERGQFEDEIESMGGRIFRVRPFKGYNLFLYYRDCRKFFCEHPEIKIVHGHLGSCAAYYLLAAKKRGKFTIAHSHSAKNIHTFYNVAYRFFSYPTRWIADQLFGCSTEAGIVRYGKKTVRTVKYRNFNNAVDPVLFRFDPIQREALRREFGIGKDTLVIGTVGRITIPKNPLRIYSIFKEVLRLNPNALCLWIGTGGMENEIKRLIALDGMEQRIIMTGIRSDVPAILTALDCMLFPSLWEGLPVSVVESQMANLPCVLSTNISREVQFSHLLSWHSLSDSDYVWASEAIDMAQKYRGNREKYTFSPLDSGYDIDTTTRTLTNFYEEHTK